MRLAHSHGDALFLSGRPACMNKTVWHMRVWSIRNPEDDREDHHVAPATSYEHLMYPNRGSSMKSHRGGSVTAKMLAVRSWEYPVLCCRLHDAEMQTTASRMRAVESWEYHVPRCRLHGVKIKPSQRA